MKEIVFATNNNKKLEEVRAHLGTDWKVLSLEDIGFYEDIPETGTTFKENAAIKANVIAGKFGINCFADDSGLEVSALHGEPGVYSARYAGAHGNSEANNKLLLQRLKVKSDRSARFITVIALRVSDKLYYFEGTVNGKIIEEARGNNGFGYDPLFIPEGYTKTFAEMDLTEKNKISHRARAVNKLVDFLKSSR